MPVDKVRVEHKFGIISHSQRLLLEDRLDSKSDIVSRPSTSARNRILYEVSEDFVAKFNDINFDDQEDLVSCALKMLTRAKRRAGLREGCVGEHVNLPKAWAELSLLAQLYNKEIQEQSLEALITSLNQAPFLPSHISSLFFLAMSSLHWLRKIGLHQPYLRSGEIKLIKMGHLVFLRLYHFYLTNQLMQIYTKEKQTLLLYLSGVSEQQHVYKAFPGSLLSVRFMTEVGYLICKGVQVPPDHPHGSESNLISHTLSQGGADQDGNVPNIDSSVSKGSALNYFGTEKITGMEKITEEDANESNYSPSPFHSITTVESIHDLTATLWHALDVWRRCATHKGIGLQRALIGLSVCGTGLAAESWLDVSCAFYVLAQASSSNLGVLQTFQALAAGAFHRPAVLADVHAQHVHLCDQCHSSFVGDSTTHAHYRENATTNDGISVGSDYISVGQTPSFVRGLRDFANLGFIEKTGRNLPSESDETESLRSRDDKRDSSFEASFADVSSVESECVTRRKSGKIHRRVSSRQRPTHQPPRTEDQSSSSDEDRDVKEKVTKRDDVTGRASSSKGRLGTGVRFQTNEPGDGGGVGTNWSPTQEGGLEREFTKGSLFSANTVGSTVTIPMGDEDDKCDESTATKSLSMLTEHSGLYSWSWELAYLYTEAMTSVCLHGNSSIIKKVALLGSEAYRKPKAFASKTAHAAGLGLADMLKFEIPDTRASPNKNWGWRVRFAAVEGLVRVSRHCHGDSTKDGIRGVAWNLLMRHHSKERDMRVLEALKLAKVEVDLDNNTQPAYSHFDTLASHMAKSLSSAMLPQLPPVVPVPEVTSRPRVNKVAKPPTKRVQTRPSLRQEILLATAAYEPPLGYNARMNNSLMSVIEDQWRKQLHVEEIENEAETKKREGQRILLNTSADRKLEGRGGSNQ